MASEGAGRDEGQHGAVTERQVRALLETVLEQAPLGFAFFDPELRYSMINEALAEINGAPVEAHLGRHLLDMVPEVGARARITIERVLATGVPVHGEEVSGETPAQPGVWRTWSQNYYRVSAGTEVIGVAALVQEVTEERRMRERTLSLAQLAQRLASARTSDLVGETIVEMVPVVLGAESASLRFWGTGAGSSRSRGPAGLSPEGEVGSTELVLHDGDDRPIAELVILWGESGPSDLTNDPTLSTVTELLGQTLERVRLYEVEHTLVQALQSRVLREIPPHEGLDVAARYLAAEPGLSMGGDFYDGVPLEGDRLAVVVGDITGHGVQAAADMAELRTILHAALALGGPIGEVFDHAQNVLRRDIEFTLASAVIAVVDVATSTLSYVSAGHPPLLMRDPSGTVMSLEGARRTLLGLPAPPVEAATVAFGPGSVLVAYTDGLVERPGETIDAGIERLGHVLSDRRGTTADELAESILSELIGGAATRDDVAFVVVMNAGAD